MALINHVIKIPKTYADEENNNYDVSGIKIKEDESDANLQGDIYWVQVGTSITISASCQLPDGEMIGIVEQIINGEDVVDDMRIKLNIMNGSISSTFSFAKSGNWVVSAKRLNEGLKRIGKDIKLVFNNIEFDVY